MWQHSSGAGNLTVDVRVVGEFSMGHDKCSHCEGMPCTFFSSPRSVSALVPISTCDKSIQEAGTEAPGVLVYIENRPAPGRGKQHGVSWCVAVAGSGGAGGEAAAECAGGGGGAPLRGAGRAALPLVCGPGQRGGPAGGGPDPVGRRGPARPRWGAALLSVRPPPPPPLPSPPRPESGPHPPTHPSTKPPPSLGPSRPDRSSCCPSRVLPATVDLGAGSKHQCLCSWHRSPTQTRWSKLGLLYLATLCLMIVGGPDAPHFPSPRRAPPHIFPGRLCIIPGRMAGTRVGLSSRCSCMAMTGEQESSARSDRHAPVRLPAPDGDGWRVAGGAQAGGGEGGRAGHGVPGAHARQRAGGARFQRHRPPLVSHGRRP